MHHNKNHPPKQESVFIKMMNFVQWANYKGGIMLIFICSGCFVLITYPFLCFFDKENNMVIFIGFSLIIIGFIVRYFEWKNNLI